MPNAVKKQRIPPRTTTVLIFVHNVCEVVVIFERRERKTERDVI